ncbi:hypothetical protein H4R99_000877 [Coemansia sp. RSA 1722]|nr:hypothetical protein LPJ57_000349 [Coemansia sp. RSA 486]KAJ2237637.1 hypothetical protein IWW45_000739 [Coemansia sp. RSA 485]KAJ2601700.1 hypothetical protein GGF39_001101 [Coemansia sp. RSA 1721]KAJ2605783.1 hypothetical protein H4R99_000877 [Coemansia sp. RSA 1722]KAJ2639193.1 hypothetical protein GGF40_001055 [Coemansia sp. RSA 1286]
MNPAYSLSSSALDTMSCGGRWSNRRRGLSDICCVSSLGGDTSAGIRPRSSSESHVSSADSICSIETEFLPRMSGTIGRPHQATGKSAGAKFRRSLRSLKNRLPLSAKSEEFETGALPRNLRPSSLFHLKVRYDADREQLPDDVDFVSPADEQEIDDMPEDVGQDDGEEQKFSFSPSLASLARVRPQPAAVNAAATAVPNTAPAGTFGQQGTGGNNGWSTKQALLLSYDMGNQEGGLRSIQTALEDINQSALSCCCCNRRMVYGAISNSSRSSGGSRGLLSPLHSLMPTFTGNAHFVHTEAGPALDISSSMVHDVCPCHMGAVAKGESPVSAMRIKLRPRAGLSASLVAVGGDNQVSTATDNAANSANGANTKVADYGDSATCTAVTSRHSIQNLGHPEYLRISKSTSTPGIQRSESSNTNHLLLSGINTEFVAEHVFGRRPSSAHQPHFRSQHAEQAFEPMVDLRKMARRSMMAAYTGISSISADDKKRATELAIEALKSSLSPKDTDEPLTNSDSMSFCTALSSLTDDQTASEESDDQWIESSGAHEEAVDTDVVARIDAKPNVPVHAMPSSPVAGAGRFVASMGNVLSPQTPKSVPVVEQARKARHPVYRFGALANETFESGRYQDAYDLYSWALLLLNPQEGVRAKDLLQRTDVRRELDRLGWRAVDLEADAQRRREANSATQPGLVMPEAVASPKSPAAQLLEQQQQQQQSLTQGRTEKKGWRPFSKPGGWWVSSAKRAEEQQQNRNKAKDKPRSRQRQQPPSLPVDITSNSVVINEPLPMNVAQTPSGRFEFSNELLEQVNRENKRQSRVDSSAGGGDDSSSSDPWAMASGEEKSDISALLHSNRSAAAYALGKYAAASSDASQAIALRPQWAKGHFRRGEALLALGRIREAHMSYRKAAVLEPQDMHVRVSCERARILAQNEAMGLRVVQLLAGRDFAVRPKGLHPIRAAVFRFAQGMQNFVYLVADAQTRKCVVVDACWDVDGILAVIERERLLLAAAVVTHGHFDHTGGMPPAPFASLRIRVSGVAELKRRMPHLPLLVHPLDIPEIIGANPQLQPRHFTPTPNGFAFRLGDRTDLRFMHTPGHTPGSQCLLVNGCRLFSGDTLFPGSCGRTDLKGGSLPDMLESLKSRLCAIPDSTIVYPGHEYGGEWTSIGREKKRGFLRVGARVPPVPSAAGPDAHEKACPAAAEAAVAEVAAAAADGAQAAVAA